MITHRVIQFGPATPLALDGTVGVLTGLAFAATPDTLLALLGLHADAAAVVMARFLGGAILAHGCIQLLAIRHASGPVGSVLMRGNLPFDLLATGLSVFYVLTGTVNAMGWLFVALFGYLVIARAYWAVRLPLRPLG